MQRILKEPPQNYDRIMFVTTKHRLLPTHRSLLCFILLLFRDQIRAQTCSGKASDTEFKGHIFLSL